MSTITRERLEQLANFLGAPVTRQEEQELARIALASLEAEPVAFRSKLKSPAAIGSERWDYTDHRQPDAFELESCVIERLYTAPPALVVPELCAAIEALLDMQVRMVKQTNVGASFFDGETISAMNYAPIQARQALELAKQHK